MKKQFVNRLFISCFTIALSGLCFTACGSGSPAAGGQGGAAATEAVAEDAENGADIEKILEIDKRRETKAELKEQLKKVTAQGAAAVFVAEKRRRLILFMQQTAKMLQGTDRIPPRMR